MIRQVLINTPDASDAEIADFVHHNGERSRIRRPVSWRAYQQWWLVPCRDTGCLFTANKGKKRKNNARPNSAERSKKLCTAQSSLSPSWNSILLGKGLVL